ncbi:folylpolyglutamate synthase/dihydrofolate synthase family protein [soil metagenome]
MDIRSVVAKLDAGSGSGFITNPFLSEKELEHGLTRTSALLNRLGDPRQNLKFIHVAGSKGKGSVSAYISAILADIGVRGGRLSSPHLHTWNERIQVDQITIGNDALLNIAQDVLNAVRNLEIEDPSLGNVTTNEILLAIALVHFGHERCEYAVLEVGLGGRYDATNVVTPRVSVITTLELEHTGILGSTIEDIAWNKGGIIKHQIPTVSSWQPGPAVEVLDALAEQCRTRVAIEGRDWHWRETPVGMEVSTSRRTVRHFSPSMPGKHQRENAATAVASILQVDDLSSRLTEELIRDSVATVQLPGRFETVDYNGRMIILDVAHTLASMSQLLSALEERGIVAADVIAGFLRDKDQRSLISMLSRLSGELYLTPVASPRSSTVIDLKNSLDEAGMSAHVHGDFTETWRTICRATSAAPLVITGSFAIIREARTLLGMPESHRDLAT